MLEPEAAAKFVDDLISCSSKAPGADKNRHRHTATCFKSKAVLKRFWRKDLTAQDMHRYCRFGAPFWPSPCTRILLPLYQSDEERLVLRGGTCTWKDHLRELRTSRLAVSKDEAVQGPAQPRSHSPRKAGAERDTWEEYLDELRDLRHRLKDILVSATCPDTLQDLWRRAGCPDEETYLLVIRSGMRRPMVLYRRDMDDRWTNSHLPWVLEVVGSNNDGQLILDVYSLVRYVATLAVRITQTGSSINHVLFIGRGLGGGGAEVSALVRCGQLVHRQKVTV